MLDNIIKMPDAQKDGHTAKENSMSGIHYACKDIHRQQKT